MKCAPIQLITAVPDSPSVGAVRDPPVTGCVRPAPRARAAPWWWTKPCRAVLVAGVLLSMGEAGLRFRAARRADVTAPSAIYELGAHGLRPKPGMDYTLKGARVTINRWGLRGADFPLAKPPGHRRVLCLGNSTTYGMPGDDDATIWPARLARQLRTAAAAPVEVINGAMIGLTVADIHHRLGKELLRFAPDVVLISPLPVDIQHLARTTIDSATAPVGGQDHWLTADPQRSLLYVLAHKNTAAWLSTQMRSGHRDELPAACDRLFRDSLQGLLDRCADAGLPTALMTCPRAVDVIDRFGRQAGAALDAVNYTPQLSAAGWLDALDRLNTVVRQVAAERGLPLVDLDRRLPRESALFSDLVHFSSAGYARVAAEVLPVVRALLAEADGRVADAAQVTDAF